MITKPNQHTSANIETNSWLSIVRADVFPCKLINTEAWCTTRVHVYLVVNNNILIGV